MESAKELQGRILLVDDESAILRTFRYCLEDEGYTVATANSAAQADALLQRQVFDLCFLDLRLGEDNGLDVLAQMRVQAPWMRVVIVTAHSAVDTAVDAIQAGAADYLVKPCSPDQLRLATAKQLEVRQLSARLEALEGEVRKPKDGLDSHSPAMKVVLETARQVAGTDANILILGESGTGKGELARAIHGWSKREKKSCEFKAASTALSLIAKYHSHVDPGQSLVQALGDPADIEAILAARQNPVERGAGSGVSVERIEELEARIAALEERLARLE